MTRTVVMPRKVYEVKSKVDEPIRLYLDSGVHRHINPEDTVILLGETASRVGLDREMHRDRVEFREFNIVMPETDDPKIADSKLFKDSLKQYEGVMKHLFSGNILYMDSNGEISEKPAERTPEEPPKVDDSEQVEKLEEAVKQPDLKVVPDPDEEEEEPEEPEEEKAEEEKAEEEPEIVLDDEEDGEDDKGDEDSEEKTTKSKSSSKKGRKKKGRKKSKK